MQNIPGIELENANEQRKAVQFSAAKKGDQHALFADLFDKHSNMIENELALTPVSSKDKMVDVASMGADEKQPQVNAANTKAPVKEDKEPIHDRDRDERMTQEDLDDVKEDLKEYGLSEQEIAEIEEEVNSEEGMTWGQFVSTIAHKMADMRQVEMSDEQKGKLGSFFAKFGFTPKQSEKLISQLENGEHAKVMTALNAKLESMPQNKQMLISKDGIEAFSVAMNFSKEFTAKIKEAFSNNPLGKNVKEAFSMISQEMADMDVKDKKLVQAIGKTFVKAMGDKVKETSVAKDIKEAVDLKPRVSENSDDLKAEAKTQLKTDFNEAVETRKESMPDTNARKHTEQKVMPEKAQKSQPEMTDQQNDTESDDSWNNFFGKLRDDNAQVSREQFQAKTENIESALKTGLTETASKTKAQVWEKVSAPKVMRQVENAVIKNLGNGTKQLTLQLTPENLGKLNIMLQVQGKEISAVIKAESPEAAKIITENIDIIKNALENQGLKVEKLEVQAGLTGNQDSQDWFGQEQHNMARDREAMVAMRNHMKQMRGDNNDMAQDMQHRHEQAINADQGLHVIA